MPWRITSRGVAYGEKGDYDKAIADYTEAIRLDPKLRRRITAGAGLRAEGRLRQGHRGLYRGHPARPEVAEAYYGRGCGYGEKGDYDKAIADYTEAIRLDPKFATAYYGRGVAYGEKGDYDKAIADYTEAIRLDPKLAEAYCSRGIAYANKGDYDKAIADYTEAIRLDPKLADGVLQPGRRLRGEGRLRQGHRRLHRGHPAGPEVRDGV